MSNDVRSSAVMGLTAPLGVYDPKKDTQKMQADHYHQLPNSRNWINCKVPDVIHCMLVLGLPTVTECPYDGEANTPDHKVECERAFIDELDRYIQTRALPDVTP